MNLKKFVATALASLCLFGAGCTTTTPASSTETEPPAISAEKFSEFAKESGFSIEKSEEDLSDPENTYKRTALIEAKGTAVSVAFMTFATAEDAQDYMDFHSNFYVDKDPEESVIFSSDYAPDGKTKIEQYVKIKENTILTIYAFDPEDFHEARKLAARCGYGY